MQQTPKPNLSQPKIQSNQTLQKQDKTLPTKSSSQSQHNEKSENMTSSHVPETTKSIISTNTSSSSQQVSHQHKHNSNCNHQHPSNKKKSEQISVNMNNQNSSTHVHHCSHHNHNHNHQHIHQHSPSCKFHSQSFQPQQLTPQLQSDLTIDTSIPSAILQYLHGDLHKTWIILDKLQKANLIDKKLEGVFILKELGLNKGVGPLKSLTANNGDIPKTLKELKPKQDEKQANICYVDELPEQHTVLIDGLFLATCDEDFRKMCLSNIIDVRQTTMIKLYMLIELISGIFFMPKQYIHPQLLVRINSVVNGLKNKSQHPFRLKLNLIEGEASQHIIKTLEQAKPEQLSRFVIVSKGKTIANQLLPYTQKVKFMKGETFLKLASEKQNKQYAEEILSLK